MKGGGWRWQPDICKYYLLTEKEAHARISGHAASESPAAVPGDSCREPFHPTIPRQIRNWLGDSQQMIFNEWAALRYLEEVRCAPRLSARFYAGVADRSRPFIVMEDLAPGDGSPYQMLE